ncbi:MAG: molybdate ABC transporter substrate-binding protein [Desulfitobacteriia bacterium]|jgi:molybdate transport system substrate-binding protein
MKNKRLLLKKMLVGGIVLGLILVMLPACTLPAGKDAGDVNSPAGQLTGNDPNGKLQGELVVSAAASLQGVLTAIAKDFRQEQPDLKITFNFASSGTLQRQIEQGAPVDLFISAGKKQMDALEQQELLLPETRLDLLRNKLVLITPKSKEDVSELKDLTKEAVAQIALGTPETTPVGQYSREVLEKFGLWDLLQAKIVLAKDVTQVLNYVVTQNAEAGFVYLSDAAGSDEVRVIELPQDAHSPIVYPAAVLRETPNEQSARHFLAYLESTGAGQIFEQYGFLTE